MPVDMTTDFYDMPDEDFEKLTQPPAIDDVEEEEEETVDAPDPIEDTDAPEEGESDDSDSEEEIEEDPDDTIDDKIAAVEETDDDTPETEEEEPEAKPEDKPAEEDAEPEAAIDYEAEYKKVLAPFKANGREITPKSLEDVQRLMQMGANYHKKMAGMKPALLALKTLENNGLLDPGKLDFLIDIHQGKSEAISKLLQDHKINPLDVDTETTTPYQPANHSATESEIQLDMVLDDIKESPNYQRTLTAITKEWDDASREEAASNPKVISVINQHMDTGIYDQVMAAVNYDRSLGKLIGVSDLEAYKQTGNRLEQAGAFKPKVTSNQNTQATAPTKPSKNEQKRKALKKAAAPTTASTTVSKLPADFNPLALSDEEFAKFDPKLIGL